MSQASLGIEPELSRLTRRDSKIYSQLATASPAANTQKLLPRLALEPHILIDASCNADERIATQQTMQ